MISDHPFNSWFCIQLKSIINGCLQLPDIDNIVAMELDLSSFRLPMTVDTNKNALILPQSQKRARGDDDDEIVALCVYARVRFLGHPISVIN